MKRAILLFAIALPAFADRFTVTFDGKSIGGAEVCATRAGDPASPVTRFLTGGAPVCYPARGEVRLPPGSSNSASLASWLTAVKSSRCCPRTRCTTSPSSGR